jgi:hypothetical protein
MFETHARLLALYGLKLNYTLIGSPPILAKRVSKKEAWRVAKLFDQPSFNHSMKEVSVIRIES